MDNCSRVAINLHHTGAFYVRMIETISCEIEASGDDSE